MVKVLMVCLGNICRSPLAEGILKSKMSSENVIVDSAGTAAYHIGNLPDSRSIEIAKKHGIDITPQRARAFLVSDFKSFDYIFVMDRSNYNNIISLAENSSEIAKVKMILNELHAGDNLEVPDPYYGGNGGFENVYQLLDASCDIIAKKITN
ncbi:low molecular weight protein-tyrosine-phosphatase [Flavicella sp.]|uniref:low molecular weight protein-tyrosine-phosphatase n=1 Tax=Flavicella sp. TaxID=2957742 RepID=UPI00301B4306